MLILKLILFVVLTSIPFLYHFLIKPRRESVKKYRNVFTAAQPHMSKLKKSVWRIGTHLINFYDKMKHREKPRKFFTLLLLLFLLGIQGVDNFASGEVAALFYPNFHDPAAPKGRKPIPQRYTVERKAA